MPECWFASLPGAGACDGRLVRCHLITQQTLRRELGAKAGEVARADLRSWVWGCGGPMGPGGHHGLFKPDGPRPIPRHRLPAGLEELAVELGLVWWLDRTYGEAT